MIQRSFLVITCLFFLNCTESKEEVYDLVLLNGQMIDLENGVALQQDIFINNGRIAKMVASQSFENFRATKKIDLNGKYILPGFWDNHVHFRGGDSLIQSNKDFLKLFMANGITTVRDAGGDLTTDVLNWRNKIAESELIGPSIYTSGPKIDGPQPTWAGSLSVENESDIKKALDSLEKINVDFIKLYDSKISREAYLQTIREAKKRGLISSGHMPFTAELNETIDAGIGAIEHLYFVLKGCSINEKRITEAIRANKFGFWQSLDKLRSSYSDSTAQNTFKKLIENNVYVVPTLHIGDVLSYLDEENHLNDPYLKLMSEPLIKTYQGRINRALNSTDIAKKERKALNTFFKQLTKSLSDGQVKLLAGSDSGAYNSYTYPGISLHKEMEAMVKAGISPLEAIKTSAYNGAHFLKKEEDYGTISIGKMADLVVLNANPLDNITNSRKIFRVIKTGQVYDPLKLTADLGCQECFVQ